MDMWLKKGYDFVVHEKNFNNPDAVIDLGVGKNMVASIRYWLCVFGICERDEPTPLGDYLFSDVNGKDKYIEELATLWLLHFNLIFNQHASLYHMVSNRGTDIRTQTYVLPEKDKRRAKELEDQINVLLSGDTNIDVCTLLAILNKKLNK